MPALFQNDLDNTSRQLRSITQVDNGNVVRELKQLWQNDKDGNPRLIYAAFGGSSGVNVEPANVYGRANSQSSIRVSTGPATASATSGTAPFTFAWSLADLGWEAFQPASATTAFISPVLGPGDSEITSATVTVTDAYGMTATSLPIQVTASNNGSFGSA